MHAHRGRPWWERAAALWLAAWFLVAALDLPALHTCAMHGLGARPAAATPGMAAHAGHDTAGHDAAAAHAPDAPAHHGGHACTCLGDCSAAVSALPPAPPAVLAERAPVRVRVPAPGRPAHEYVAAWADFVLPFSTAPPAVTAA